jgi:hypothetical protein
MWSQLMTTKLFHNTSRDEASERSHLSDLSAQECAAVGGGRMKLPSAVPPGKLLMGPDGDPVTVYVDGVCINSPADGYVHL